MLRNYVKSAVRSLMKQKGYALLNIAGLTIGMTCCLLIFQYVVFQLSFDSHHEKSDRVYRVLHKMTQNGEPLDEVAWTSWGEAPAYAEEVPGVVRYARIQVYFGGAIVSPVRSADVAVREEGAYFVDPNFLSMFTMPFVAGDPASALRDPHTLLISESSARNYFGSVYAVGERFRIRGPWTEGDYTVVGVFEDVPPTSHLQAEFLFPMQDLLATERYSSPFEFFFADQEFDQLYRNDRRFARLFGLFAGLAIFIACLGLFGLAAFTAQRRTKEIGVRKVLGASVQNVTVLLARDYLLLVLVGFIIAVPLAYLGMQRWLENFAYRIDVSAWVFLIAGLSALLIALVTVGYQSIKAATADPVESLRYE